LNGLTCHGTTLRAHEETTNATINIFSKKLLRCDWTLSSAVLG
jgi:hypothetical protein